MRYTPEALPLFDGTYINGVAIPTSALSSTLARYVTNLVVVNEDPVYQVSLRGSATPIRIRDRFLLACCYHQVGDADLKKIGLLSSDGRVIVTSAGVHHFVHRTGSDFSDLVVFDFTAPCMEHVDLQDRFFPLRDIPPDAPNTDTLFLQVAGYPSKEQKYELEEHNHLGLVKRRVACDLARPPADEALQLLRTSERLAFDPDGMSGGSAFTVQLVGGRQVAYFAGMIVRAGPESFYILKSGYIRSVMNSFIAEFA
ncbi:hypothetical protein SM0020_10485 [Sinorhizobium meliloti CCNWSX0020]|uniref:Uncharacterized protein n=1 Tax=Sinorhizobium meliloti CCNWSX0020 TaxID=1107881 RepID=H0FY27_RHIML|nr:hypothetical protein [Sinorhizobium meliloti]EHK78099.1 hypothetical protein SM0020_10485 [Sinorhizobium meliloti CCNWSX0020]